jgi:hypothetical protein
MAKSSASPQRVAEVLTAHALNAQSALLQAA